MNSSDLPEDGKLSFWKTKKATFSLIAVFLVIVAVAGFYLYYSQTEGEQKLASSEKVELPEEWLSIYFTQDQLEDEELTGFDKDPDGDGLLNYQELVNGTNPTAKDTDNDGIFDGIEVAYESDPLIYNYFNIESTPMSKARSAGAITGELATEGLFEIEEMEETFQINRPLVLPEIPDSKINIVESTAETRQTYAVGLSEALSELSKGGFEEQFSGLFSAVTQEQIAPLKSMTDAVTVNLYKLKIPANFVFAHKNRIIFFGAVKKIAEAQEQIIKDPENSYPVWGEIIYQSRIIAIVGNALEGFLEE
ncbi:MAG: hypothetical protein COT91_02455 [Candidatus Doudnabacteria bacterium CG10_big_fil_rev_8_21_14_0_10_41_10]|uniref:EF-hand domain-containing protein n=1 Tax=Candidatus Doudnabacteria bacterium CG10_big_fil_rev_8_21_14_0_10_41_10 TaxID=1974551 RepID=A0A2H0VDS1_9BACT|nr:MAG: hypothetical protein COT91_02455 [Candidatus Doudnabacteria bacterium CG10_big_fil_rev_8_21_14_0_10_41_10]